MEPSTIRISHLRSAAWSRPIFSRVAALKLQAEEEARHSGLAPAGKPKPIDYASFLGKSFRVGWGIGGVFVDVSGGTPKIRRLQPLNDPLPSDLDGVMAEHLNASVGDTDEDSAVKEHRPLWRSLPTRYDELTDCIRRLHQVSINHKQALLLGLQITDLI